MRVRLRNPNRELELAGPLAVGELLRRLGVNREAVLVMVDGTLVTGDATVPDGATVEVRPVISGGAGASPGERAASGGAAGGAR